MTAAPELRRRLSAYSLMLYERGWVANHDGNVSVRSGDGFLITPTAVSKRLCTPESLVLCGADGRPVGRGRPPSEVALHVGAFRVRPGVGAIVHAHPPYASAFALARRPLGPVAMPEVVVSLGAEIPLVPLLLPKDPAAADVIGEAVLGADALLLTGNGVLTVGEDLEQAFLRMELVEHYARITSIAQSIGGVVALDSTSTERMLELRRAAGLGPKPSAPPPSRAEPATTATAPSPARASGAAARLAATIRPLVADEIRRALKGEER
jgi:L-fuculose-phosphate aldolase